MAISEFLFRMNNEKYEFWQEILFNLNWAKSEQYIPFWMYIFTLQSTKVYI